MAEKLTTYTLDELADRLDRRAASATDMYGETGDNYFAGKAAGTALAAAELRAIIAEARRRRDLGEELPDDIASGNVWPTDPTGIDCAEAYEAAES